MIRPLALCVLAFLLAANAAAQNEPQIPSAREIEKLERHRELEVLRGDLTKAKESEAILKAEIEAIKNDRKKLSQALIEVAARVRNAESQLTAAEKRLSLLEARETVLRGNLDSRRAVLTEVLAALSRLGRQPPPALLLRPEDALESVRAAVLLGAVIPELKAGAEALAANLAELVRLRREITVERDTLAINRAALEEDHRRISALVEERQRALGDNEKTLESERARAQALAKQVETVSELVTRMEREIESAARAAEAARREEAAKFARARAEPGRIGSTLMFKDAKGLIPLPVAGTRFKEFGASDGIGGTERGVSFTTRAGAQVVAPCDGWIVYVGNFRSYGQLLIINAGGGYHLLLAGMERITVELGQFVLAGEPVGVMGSGPRLASASALGSSQPILYVEFRKDGNSIDPSPWWATSEDEKARG